MNENNSRPAVFLDRDNTLIEDPDYLRDPKQVRLLPGAAGAVSALREAGYSIVVVTNQSGIARGYLTEQELANVHERMKQLLRAEGATLDAIYYCPYFDGPAAVVGQYRRDSDLRKPRPGMLLKAAQEHDLTLSASWMIGDSERDIEAGRAAGCRTILIGDDRANRLARAEFTAQDLAAAAAIILDQRRPPASLESPAESPPDAGPPEEPVPESDVRSDPRAEEPPLYESQTDNREPESPVPAPASHDTVAYEPRMNSVGSIGPWSPPRTEDSPPSPSATEPAPAAAAPTAPRRIVSAANASSAVAAENEEPEIQDRAPQTLDAPGPMPPGIESALREILEEIRTLQREQRSTEFSIAHLLGAVMQAIALFPLGLGLYAAMDGRGADALVRLLIAISFQLLAITGFALGSRK